jgi:hypothetical protein
MAAAADFEELVLSADNNLLIDLQNAGPLIHDVDQSTRTQTAKKMVVAIEMVRRFHEHGLYICPTYVNDLAIQIQYALGHIDSFHETMTMTRLAEQTDSAHLIHGYKRLAAIENPGILARKMMALKWGTKTDMCREVIDGVPTYYTITMYVPSGLVVGGAMLDSAELIAMVAMANDEDV